ncbi:DUF4397 domain-containing protein [Streptomyces sp. JJ36]|uniref:DUF4397 domain-containing protein n=1 Tax=Streptomyces sp. JJ36 TaxID=2736645 RepID=UPI001F4372FB|nr:DUF4397 domain-containing protein [Streptomyces sp. JJ36]MCF6525828.1 DUF4397 domain-containing protein [Streptomyces sp. JJ36]
MAPRLLRAALALGTAPLLALAALPAGSAAAAGNGGDGGNATVSVFHGIPGTPVDVYANGEELLPDFQPGTLTDPLSLPAGSYDIEIFKAGAPTSGEPVVEKQVDVPGGANATVVANLTENGEPALNAFVNDVSEVPAGKSRLTVRHVAAAPAVDVRADGQALFKGLKNPKEASAEVPAGTVEADVVLAGTEQVVIGPAELDLAAGGNTVVYAWGSADDGNLALKVQDLSAGTGTPGAPDAGETGQAARSGTGDAGRYALAAGALLAALVAGARLTLRRR